MALQETAPPRPAQRKTMAVVGAALLGIASLTEGIGMMGFRHGPHITAMSSGISNAAARPRAVQQPIACEKLPNVPGKSITTLLVSFPPLAFTPRHRHPGSVTAYVLKGTLRSQLNDGPVGTFSQGGTWFEPPGTIHSMVENPSPSEPAEIMAIFVADSDCGALTIFED